MRLFNLLPKTWTDNLQGSRSLILRLGWTTAGYAGLQVVRFAQNLILTRLVAPDLFGVMVILTSLRVGVELFTDVGIGQNLVASPHGAETRYRDTAWTMQVLRGLLLTILFLLLLPILRHYYADPLVSQAMPGLCVLFLFTGLHGMGPFLATKAMQTHLIARYDVACAIAGAVSTLLLAHWFPNVLGLMAGQIASIAFSTSLSYLMFPERRFRLTIDREVARSILSFGKWLFVSSVVFFLASNLDRLVLAKYVSLAMLGIYGVARSLGDIFGQFALRIGNAIIFPSISRANLIGRELRDKIAWHRWVFLLASAGALSLLIGFAELIIRILYDQRYHAAGPILAWVAVATWVYVVSTVGENVAMGLRRPLVSALGQGAKFVVLVVALPLLAARFGVAGAVLATLIGETGRYVVITATFARAGIHFVRQDVAGTVVLLGGACAVRGCLYLLGFAEQVWPLTF